MTDEELEQLAIRLQDKMTERFRPVVDCPFTRARIVAYLRMRLDPNNNELMAIVADVDAGIYQDDDELRREETYGALWQVSYAEQLVSRAQNELERKRRRLEKENERRAKLGQPPLESKENLTGFRTRDTGAE